MNTVVWPDTDVEMTDTVQTYRVRAELIVSICSEIRAAIKDLARTGDSARKSDANGYARRALNQHARELVQQLSHMEQLARQLMDTTIVAEALGTGHAE